jgi:hypothetical protein
MPDEILKLLREIHQTISRQLSTTSEVTREDWIDLLDKITDAIEEQEKQ